MRRHFVARISSRAKSAPASRMSGHPAVQKALRNHYFDYFDSPGLPDSMFLAKPNPVEPPWYVTRMPGGVGGVAPRGVPPYPINTGTFIDSGLGDASDTHCRRERWRTSATGPPP
jgi:hypothetical protein